MIKIEDEALITALSSAVGKDANYIMESCNTYHFYFDKTSFSYTKGSIIKILSKLL